MTLAEQVASTIPAPSMKSCSCGASYDALAWAALPALGEMDDGEGGRITLKNCAPPCFSTLAVPS